MDIFQLLNGNTSNMNEEEQVFVSEFTNKLRDKIIDELVEQEADELIKKLEGNKTDFVDSLGQVLVNGTKGFNNMTTQILVNIYLEKKTDVDFVRLIEEIE